MCFSPQRRAIFRHRNFKKCSEDYSFWAFALPNVLFATAACIFSTGEQQKVLRTWRVLYIFTSKCAFRHSGVQFLISPLTTWLRTRRFNSPTFGLTRHTNHRENTAFRDFSNIWRGCIFLLRTFALLHLLPSDLTACLIYFSTLHIVGSLLFKLPSISWSCVILHRTSIIIKVVFRFFLGGKQLLMFFGYITVKVMGKNWSQSRSILNDFAKQVILQNVILLLDEPSKNKIWPQNLEMGLFFVFVLLFLVALLCFDPPTLSWPLRWRLWRWHLCCNIVRWSTAQHLQRTK